MSIANRISPAMAVVAVGLTLVTACMSRSVNEGTVSDASVTPDPNTTAGAVAEPPTWGKRFTWPNGLAVEVSAPQPCRPSEYDRDIQRAVKLAVTIINGTDKPVEASAGGWLSADAQFDGRKAETINVFFGDSDCDTTSDSPTILPGKTYAYQVGVAVGSKPGELQLEVEVDVSNGKAVFVGPA